MSATLTRPFELFDLGCVPVQMTRAHATVEPAARAFATVERLKKLEKLLDRQFTVAGVNFGIDSVIGLVPVVGDLITGALGFYLISEARKLGVSRWTLTRMYSNLGIDVTVGAIPIVGDVFDLAFKSNSKNLKLMLRDLEKREAKELRRSSRKQWFKTS